MSDTLLIVIAVLAVLLIGLVIFRSLMSGQRDRPVGEEGAERLSREPEPKPLPAAPAETVAAPADAITRDTDADSPDELTRIKGLGSKLAAKLEAAGVIRYAQIAGWSEADIEAVAADLGKPDLADRIARDRWVDQAALLARGDTAAFEAEFGKLG